MPSDVITISGSGAARLKQTAERYGFTSNEFVDYIVNVMNGADILSFKQKEDLLPLNAKIEIAEVVIRSLLDRSHNPLILWLGDPKSTMMLYLVRELSFKLGKPVPRVLFIDHPLHYKETMEFIKSQQRLWKIDVAIAYNEKLIGMKAGEVLRVDELPREQSEELHRIGYHSESLELSLDNQAALDLLVLQVLEKFIRENCSDCVFRSEINPYSSTSNSSQFLFKEHGITLATPLVNLTDAEVRSYSESNHIPLNPAHSMKYASYSNQSDEELQLEFQGVAENLKRLGYA